MRHDLFVLAGIVPARRDLLLRALTALEPDHFKDEVSRGLFSLLSRYYDLTGDILPERVLPDILARQQMDEARQLSYTERFAEALELTVADHEFSYSVSALKDARETQLTGQAIASAFEILERDLEVDGEVLKGHVDARNYLYRELANVDRLSHAESAPEGDMRAEYKDILSKYADRKNGSSDVAIRSGIPELDAVSGGFYPGELDLIAAYAGSGKSQMLSHVAHHAAVHQGKNVYFSTSETIREQIIRRIVARHSREPQFNCPGGLNVTDIKNGSLTPDHEVVLQQTLEDLHYNSTYGKLFVSQVPRNTTMGQWESSVLRQAELWHVDLLCMDYLALLKPDRHRNNAREEANDILKDAKVFASSFYNGAGVPLLSPWQINRASYDQVLSSGGAYSLNSLAETSEAERSADAIVTLFRPEGETREAFMQVLKNRDGETPDRFKVAIDFRNAYFGPLETAVDDLDDLYDIA